LETFISAIYAGTPDDVLDPTENDDVTRGGIDHGDGTHSFSGKHLHLCAFTDESSRFLMASTFVICICIGVFVSEKLFAISNFKISFPHDHHEHEYVEFDCSSEVEKEYEWTGSK
jgi:hypothetical protein